jgi:hypothetical protein
MGWQERFRELGEQLTAGQISTDEYRARSEVILAEADSEAASEADSEADSEAASEAVAVTPPTRPTRQKVRIPRSAAWEAPSGEMTQIVGTRDETTLVGHPDANETWTS